MIKNNSMIAEFNENTIIKVIVDKENPGTFTIITLDENGEEVDNTYTPGFPMMEAKLVNNSSHDVGVEYGIVGKYGIITHKPTLLPQEELTIRGLIGTPDGETYIFPVSGYDDSIVQYAVTDTTGCMLYGGFIVITDTDPSSVRKCTITFTDL